MAIIQIQNLLAHPTPHIILSINLQVARLSFQLKGINYFLSMYSEWKIMEPGS